MPSPSLAEVRATGQPPEIFSRLNDEHWAGRAYMRRVSPGATWIFARLGWPPNAVTAGFIACGLAAGAVLALGGLASAIIAAVLVQAYLLLDCADDQAATRIGLEVAREVRDVALEAFNGVYLITPFLRYDVSVDLLG